MQEIERAELGTGGRDYRDQATPDAKDPLAKTDGIDAKVLAHYAEAIKPELRVMRDMETRKLRGLLARRRQLLAMIVAEGNRATHEIDAVRHRIAATIRCLKKQVMALDHEFARFIRETPLGMKSRRCYAAFLVLDRSPAPRYSANFLNSALSIASISRRWSE